VGKEFLKNFNCDSNSPLAIVSYCCVDFYSYEGIALLEASS